LLGLTSVALELGDLASAQDSLGKASEIIGSSVPAGFPAQVSLQIMRGRVELANDQLAEARVDLDAAASNVKVATATLPALLARTELNLQEGNLPAAQDDAHRALSLAQAAQGGIPYSNRTGLTWLMLGRVVAKQGDAARAKQAFQAAVEHLSNTVDADHPKLLQARELALD
jgi:hypothetical protein